MEMLWTFSGVHLIFIYVPIQVQMFLTLWKPWVMFPFNFTPLFQLSFLWICHLWCLYNLFGCMYHCWHSKWCHSAPHHFLCPCFYAFCSLLILELEVPPSSTVFFLLKALIKDSIATFFLFSSVVCISSLVVFTLAGGFYGFSFWWTNRY